jgi:uncharacterized protein (DUF2062 family)
MRALLRKLWHRVLWLWKKAKNENASPRQIGWAIGVGVYCGCSPFWGLRWALALGFATLFRLNRLLTYVGSRLSSNFVVTIPMALLEVQVAHKLRTGEFLSVTHADFEALDAAPWVEEKVKAIFAFIGRIFVDFALGSLLVGVPLCIGMGVVAYQLARLRDRRRELAASAFMPSATLLTRTPDELPRPSSESPP